MVIATSSSSIRSSMLISPSAATIFVLRSSPYFSLISRVSSTIICIRISSFAKISRKRAIWAITSLYSSRILSRSRPVKRCKRISRMAFDCKSLNPKRVIKPSLASSGFFEPRMSAITSSKWSRAISKPSKICARSSALRKSYWVLRTITSWRKSTK